jgi:hypothetical protein
MRASATGGQLRAIDASVFMSWLAARADRHTVLAHFYEQRFRPEFARAFRPWLAAKPLEHTSAPATPFAMPQYRLAAEEEAIRCEAGAAKASDASQSANGMSDAYVLNTVIFALVMFFAGATQRLESRGVRLLLLSASVVALAAGVLSIARLPAA